MKRWLLLLFLTATVAGCGGSVARHIVHHHHHHRALSAALCGFHAWRLAHDVNHGHLGWGAFQAWRTAHHCRRAVRL